MRCTLETLSPLHIGSGGRISPIEYIADDRLYRLDMDSVFRDDRFDAERYIREMMGGVVYIGSIDEGVHRRSENIRYAVDAERRVLSELRNLASRGAKDAEIYEFVKSADRPYIPASSVKGAIRTALLWHALKNDKRALMDECRYLEKNRRIDKRRADDKIEGQIFRGPDGNTHPPTHDVMRSLRVTDSTALPLDSLTILEVKTLTTRRGGYGWKKFSTFVEAMRPKTTVHLDISLDKFLLDDSIARELGLQDKIEMMRSVPESCNSFAYDLIDHELRFFREHCAQSNMGARMLEFYEHMRRLPLTGGEFLLRLGWGSGWDGMTVGRLLKECPNMDFHELLMKFHLGKGVRNIPFPKTRKVAFMGIMPYPLGWVKVRLE
ncbi:type III-A CRISPR-associated RAMP protein Csm5 [Methermicoccus shengliensis]|uniref:CRISPR system Cms protein Csm5 n=1 Tax=Methermicoccus shengliensis TaxID=660064 RepID=A0A832VXQ1_9EURY|nr:type III-A CRISPR-associated RAMP protein Csm5 [Methermicoccus shengliensis]MDI3488595.1 CRISPR-associated protein Csm5 [Methanosarcinales archaeon]MDN5294832.1 CRISPR-associated protein Csm5 [Methanosarcinales archaeon]HIH70052.1 type III-A CRISPR-associated RAMP protein Csm5 [Methermicoccus shengliensis]